MFDGIGDNTEVWRGRAAYLAGPKPVDHTSEDYQQRRKAGPDIYHRPNPYLRYKVHLPIVPGRILSSVVATKRPDAAELIGKALPHWASLHCLGARIREQSQTDEMVLSDLLVDMAREFTTFVTNGFKKEARVISNQMGDLEAITSSMGSYPTLEDCVIESAKRTLAFVDNAELGHDLLVAGGVIASLISRHATNMFQLAESGSRVPNVRSTFHPFLNGIPSPLFVKNVAKCYGDPETAEPCMVAHGGRELGLLLSDLCTNEATAVYVKTIARQSDSSKLDLDANLAVRLRPTTVRRLALPQGLSPQDCLVLVSERSDGLEFPASGTAFMVTPATEFTHVQDFIVDGRSVLLSYAPGWSEERADRSRLSDRVLKLRSPVDAMADVAISGDAVCDRSIAAAMAVRVRTHSKTSWAKQALFHRVRVAYSNETGAVIVAIRICGWESHFGIPYDRVIRKLKEKRDRVLAHLHRDHETGHLMARYLYDHNGEVPAWPEFARAAHAVLSREINNYDRIENKDEFLRAVGSEVRNGQRRPFLMNRAALDRRPLMEV
ncbi:hypothetical protein O9X98_07065 [Agrobacterium salinitolerans]|nr:hypothetical protein [Agrobacterium salinitolerans]